MEAVRVHSDRTVKVLVLSIGSLFFAGILVLAFDDPVPVLGALGIAVAVIAVVNFPIAALFLLLAAGPFHHAIKTALQAKAGLSIGPLTYWKDALIIVLFFRGAVRRFLNDRRLNLARDGGDYVLLFYVLVYVALAITSPHRASVPVSLGLYVEGPLLFLAIRWLRPSRKQLAWCVGLMLGAAAVVGIGALIEKLGPHAGFVAWYGGNYAPGVQLSFSYRAGSFFTDFLVLAFYLAGAAPLAAALTTIRGRWRHAALIAFLLCAGGLLVTLTRSGYIGGGIGIMAALLLSVRNRRIRASLVGLFIVGGSVAGLHYVASGNEAFARPGYSLHLTRVQHDIDLVVAKPFGYGLGSTDRPARTITQGVAGATENIYLGKAIDGGVQALVVYLIAIFVTGMRVRSARLRARLAGDTTGMALAAGAIGAMLGVALSGLFLGIDELVINMVLWGAPAIALAWPISGRAPQPALDARAGAVAALT